MKEAYVTFETAQRLKEKGFDWGCNGHWYIGEGKTFEISSSTDPINWNEVKTDLDWLSCPTQQMAMRWLREEKGIHICTVPDLSSNKFYVSIAINVNGKWRLHANFPAPLLDEKYIKCEDAIEVALEYALTKLI